MDASLVTLLAILGGAIAILYGVYLTLSVLRLPRGNEKMQEIAAAIQEGAAAYLNRQYTIIAIVAVVIFIGIFFRAESAHSYWVLDRSRFFCACRLHRYARGGSNKRPNRGVCA